jgi:hypothetical protein
LPSLSNEELAHTRNLGAAAYLGAFVRLMARHLEIDDSDEEALNALALEMVESVNLGTEAAWCSLMNDRQGMDNALARLRDTVEKL